MIDKHDHCILYAETKVMLSADERKLNGHFVQNWLRDRLVGKVNEKEYRFKVE